MRTPRLYIARGLQFLAPLFFICYTDYHYESLRFLYSCTFGRAEPLATHLKVIATHKATLAFLSTITLYSSTPQEEVLSLSTIVILKQDRVWAEQRVAELEKEIQAMGPEFYDALNQSSESWHDNAPFDAARDKQSVIFAEYTNLKRTLLASTIHVPKHADDVAGIGSIIKVTDARRARKIYIAGDWTHRAGQHQGDIVIVSAQSPIAKGFLGKKVGTVTEFGTLSEIDNHNTLER